jgi:hypothetical protein
MARAGRLPPLAPISLRKVRGCRVSAPSPRRAGNVLLGVAATGRGQAWASGATGSNKAVILSWNGSAWR